jgi:hypothetical protein
MPELSSVGSRLARRVVQDRGAIALSRARALHDCFEHEQRSRVAGVGAPRDFATTGGFAGCAGSTPGTHNIETVRKPFVKRSSGAGLPLVSATCRVSRRKDRAGTARCAPDHAAGGSGRSVGRIPGGVGGRDASRLHVRGRGGRPVRRHWTPQEIRQADAQRRAKPGGP